MTSREYSSMKSSMLELRGSERAAITELQRPSSAERCKLWIEVGAELAARDTLGEKALNQA